MHIKIDDMHVSHKRVEFAVDRIVKLKHNAERLIFRDDMPDQRVVRIAKYKRPRAVMQPRALAVNPHPYVMARFFADSMIFKSDIREVEIMHFAERIQPDVKFAVAQDNRSRH